MPPSDFFAVGFEAARAIRDEAFNTGVDGYREVNICAETVPTVVTKG